MSVFTRRWSCQSFCTRRRHGHYWPPTWGLWKPFIWDASDRSQVFAGSITSATRLSHHIPVSRQLASKLLAVASLSLAILPDWAHQALRAHVDLSLGRLSGRDWKRRPGRPNNRWVDQVRNDTGSMPSTLWRSAIVRGHGTVLTQRPSPATRTWWCWHPILHRLPAIALYWSKYRFCQGLTNKLFSATSANTCILLKTRFFVLQFCCRQYGSNFNDFDVSYLQIYR